jgi:cytochrome o ubiquinol oxidase subunit II
MPAAVNEQARAIKRRAFALAAMLMLAGCAGPSVLDPHGPVGAEERQILFNALAIMLAIVVPTIAATLAFAWWFRAGNAKAQFRPEFVYSGRVELVVWSIPTLVILFLGGIIWIGSHKLDPSAPLDSATKPLEVQAISLDWKWLFIYPDQHIAAINQLVVPAGTPVHFSFTSASVMNTFFVPQLGGMIYTMNGMRTQLSLLAAHEGAFYGRSTQFSGDGFPGMQFTLRAVSSQAFDAWVKAAQGAGRTLDHAEYTRLAAQSMDVPPAIYRTVDDQLFEAVVTQALPPGPGPKRASRPGDGG